MNVGLFATGGYTETGGLQQFLARIPGVECKRLFPATMKPAPKLGREFHAPRREHGGVTGDALVDRMFAILADHPGDFDAYVFVDDADCRFCGDEAAFRTWADNLAARVRMTVGRDVPLVVLLASQEVEGWLLADFEATFGWKYPTIAHALRGDVARAVSDDLESFGCPAAPSGGCETKPSEWLMARIEAHPGHRYSKRTDGAAMLRRARPDQVAARCPRTFRPAYQEILRLAGG